MCFFFFSSALSLGPSLEAYRFREGAEIDRQRQRQRQREMERERK